MVANGIFKKTDREHDWNLYLLHKNEIPGPASHEVRYSEIDPKPRSIKIVTG